ncbi:DUF4160 domain-containing protein [Candidatus Magnetobacterium casensis]|uniref:DUF4160 domain-containing protein n=1 Tax=Candidatus Magnetobacterium casense TaxID=1455061 RepID=A0ABS6S199_9BACT|nr:DUF4160 domain-containing protein [Candidatus Magnetobacterium casensis]
MSPILFSYRGYRFFFFSKEESRPHVHVRCSDGEAKFWIEPDVSLAINYGLKENQITEIRKIIKENSNEIRDKWTSHFGGC